MAKQALATVYRPTNFIDVIGQESVTLILQNQIETGAFNHAYLFTGGAGTGKTTCARIFADEINKYKGKPIEIDAASNNGVDQVRIIIEDANKKSMDSEYKVFILDEVHMLSNSAWNALLKIIEEPPAKTIFIFCTTDPQKIPATIISRVQRFDFNRVSNNKIVARLLHIIHAESVAIDPEYNDNEDIKIFDFTEESLFYIADLADGGMRDAISLLDKCMSGDFDLTLDTVIKKLGGFTSTQYQTLFNALFAKEVPVIISIVNNLHDNGVNLKQFIRHGINYVVEKIAITLSEDGKADINLMVDVLNLLMEINNAVKFENNPKNVIIAMFIKFAFDFESAWVIK
jgi:DNA polymerase III, gamma/tau subunits